MEVAQTIFQGGRLVSFQKIITGVIRWARRLRGKFEGKEHCDFMVKNFQCHMQGGLFHIHITDTYYVDNRILE